MGIKKMMSIVSDRTRDVHERLFVLIAFIALGAIFLALVLGIILGESLTDLLAMGAGFVIFMTITEISYKKNRIALGANILAALVIYIMMPVTLFTGGGVDGGAPLWFVFSSVFIAMVIKGKLKWFYLVSGCALEIGCCVIAYIYPDLVARHDELMKYEDIIMSLVMVTALVVCLISFEMRFFSEEKSREEEQRKEIEELSDAQNRFFSSMSHEIRTPINTIIGLNEMILREDISDEVATDAIHIQGASKILLHLINDILDMSKFRAGEMELTCDNYHTGDMLSDIVSMHWMRAREKGLELNIELAPDLPSELYGDEIRIKQIIINLLNNAIKYTREGSVSLSVQCRYEENDDVTMIYTVSDTGIGIKKESIPYLFTAFKRVDEHENKYIEGTGLGLSIVKQFVDLMNGKITVNSVYTKGSTFIMEIPQRIINRDKLGNLDVLKKHRVTDRQKYKVSLHAPKAKILIVDDNASNLLVAEKLLRDTGAHIDTADSAAEALTRTLETEYHIIFMDHLMPEMDGVECLERIRSQEGGVSRESKVVVLTANAGGENKTLYDKAGFDGYLLKPTNGEAMERELIRLLPPDMVTRTGSENRIVEESRSWVKRNAPKAGIIVSTESVADLSTDQIEENKIAMISHVVITENGCFRDGDEIESMGLLKYMDDKNVKVSASPPSVEDHEAFFADLLTRANNIIHVSISSKNRQTSYPMALEASKAFDNVTVIDSSHLSSGQGLVVLEVCRLVKEGLTPAEISERISLMSGRVHTSFVVDSMDYLARIGQVSGKVAKITKAFAIRPVLAMKKGNLKVGNVMFGSREFTIRRYIKSQLRHPERIDTSILFITYVGMDRNELERIRYEVMELVMFDEIIFQKASPSIAVNCGPGTFGLLFKTL